jgi:arylsulfatase A-like enzyme
MRCLLVVACLVAVAGPAPAKPLNFIVILIDDLGWTDLGCTGSDLHETPNLDRFAKTATRFTNGYSSCTVCSPTRAAMLTGKYPARLRITDWIAGHQRPQAKLSVPDWTKYLPREEVTLAEALKKAGYATGHVGKWHLGKKDEGWPTDHGFDVNRGGTERGQPPSYFSPYKIPTLEDGPAGEYLTDREADEANKFITDNRDKPFFLYMPMHAVHTPLQAKKELIEKFTKKLKPGLRHTNATYAAMMASMDETVGKVLAKLDELKIADRTVVLFTGDNGGLILRGITNNVPLRAGKGSTGVRVPLLIRWPGVTSPGSICDEPVQTIDYYPTFLELAGAKGDEKHNANVDGVSLAAVLKDPKATLPKRNLYWHYPHYHPGGATPYGAVRSGDWKLIEFFEDDHVELYNLKDDGSETTDLSAKEPKKTAELKADLHAWRKRVAAQMPSPNPKANP